MSLRVLLVTHRYPPFGLTGVERVSEQTAKSLTALGDHVTVLTRRETAAPPSPRIERTSQDGVDLVWVCGGGSSLEDFPRLAPQLDRAFERTLLDVEPDVVLISHLINHSPAYVLIAHRWGVPVVLELHDFYAACERAHLERRGGELCQGPEGGSACAVHCFPDRPRSRERWALRTHLFRRALEEADALVTPSQFVADYFRRSYPSRSLPLRVIGNGVELASVTPDRPADGERGLNLACVGVVTEHKGIHIALDALRMAGLKEAKLTLFGTVTQPYFGRLLKAADGIEGLELRAYGGFAPSELPLLLSGIDAVLVPSLVWETYSIAAREALACGVPVIASRIGALPEAVRDGENGLLFTPGSALELATILSGLDADRDQLGALRAGIRPTDWISVRERTEQLRDLLRGLVGPGIRATKPLPELEELSILRDSLLEPSLAS